VHETGELYLVRLGPVEAGGGAVELLAVVPERERLESVLVGWRERCGEPRSLMWLRERAARLRVKARAARVAVVATAAAASAMLVAATTLALELG
jgi:hypothetical protein